MDKRGFVAPVPAQGDSQAEKTDDGSQEDASK